MRCSEPRTLLLRSFHSIRTSLVVRAVADIVSRSADSIDQMIAFGE